MLLDKFNKLITKLNENPRKSVLERITNKLELLDNI